MMDYKINGGVVEESRMDILDQYQLIGWIITIITILLLQSNFPIHRFTFPLSK